jgi:DNA-binding NarL/FixJ family response regulator
MLKSGVTDEVIARRLGISYRTLQRRIADSMRIYGVRSRFQLGIQAALHEREGEHIELGSQRSPGR